jgi:hypothetical protein
MPNYVQNKIMFDCPDEKAKEILTAVMYDPDPANKDSTGYGTIDFNKLIPMPPSLMIECGSSTERGIEMYLSAINPKSSDMGLPKLSANAFRQLVLKLNQERLFSEYRSWLSDSEIAEYTKRDTMDNLLQSGKIAVDNLLKYGATTWYDWSVQNWGTKWNSCDPQKANDSTLVFTTAWSAPHPILEALTARFPGVYFTHVWADEDIGENCGQREYLNGECVGEIFPDSSKEAIEFAVSVWGREPEDYGYSLNSDGTDYIYLYGEQYDLIELFGKPALFSNGRVTESDIPQGMYVSYVRTDDSLSNEFCTLEPNVSVNLYGSIITKEPIDFGENGYIEFTEDTEPNFTGRSLSLGDFMDEQFGLEQAHDQSGGMSMT